MQDQLIETLSVWLFARMSKRPESDYALLGDTLKGFHRDYARELAGMFKRYPHDAVVCDTNIKTSASAPQTMFFCGAQGADGDREFVFAVTPKTDLAVKRHEEAITEIERGEHEDLDDIIDDLRAYGQPVFVIRGKSQDMRGLVEQMKIFTAIYDAQN